jgi:hypothetical protein
MFHPVAWKITNQWLIKDIPGILTKRKVLPDHAERALAPVSPSPCTQQLEPQKSLPQITRLIF